MQNRPNCFDFPGGDTVQMTETKSALEQLGVTVAVDTRWDLDVREYDIVHVFNTLAMPAAYYQIMNAKRQGKPVVYSTIFWDMSASGGHYKGSSSVRDAVNAVLRRGVKRELVSRENYRRVVVTEQQQEASLLASDCLLPNAEIELQQIRRKFPLVTNPALIVPNAVCKGVTSGDAARFREATGIDDGFVLTLASISPRKNQLRLAKACQLRGLRLVMIGGCDDTNQPYLKKCLGVGEDHVVHLGHRHRAFVNDAVAACRIHALVSHVETPGLASLEAAACGKNVVVCDRGSVLEYFGDDAYYCDYYSVDSISEAVSAAWNAVPKPGLSARILRDYTWNRAAEETLKAYSIVLDN